MHKLLISLFFILLPSSQVRAQSIAIPKDARTLGRPASDLIYKGARISPSEAAQLARDQQRFLGELDPAQSKLWQNKKYPSEDPKSGLKLQGQKTLSFPQQNIVKFLDHDRPAKFTYFGRVQDPNNSQQTYRLGISRYTHPMLMRSTLMRKLGYFVPAPKFYKNLIVQFNNAVEMQDFIDTAASYSTSNLIKRYSESEHKSWIVNKDDKNFRLTLSHVTLEYTEHEYFNFQWGVSYNPNAEELSSILQVMNQERAYRALLIPFVLVDIPESLNRYSASACQIINGNAVLTHEYAASFKSITYDDAIWLLKRLAKLTEGDYHEIIDNAHFPEKDNKGQTTGFKELAHAILVKRVQSIFECLNITDVKLPQQVDVRLNKGFVKNGTVQIETIDGSPFRYGHGDRESPVKDGDIARYVQIEAFSTGIKRALEEVNKQLVVRGVEDLAQQRNEELRKLITEHIRTKPNEILYMPVERWGGPIADFNVDAARHITTGTYYDSQAPIQLVDTLKVSAQAGYFSTVSGTTNMVPYFGANVRLERSFTHVRPILSLEEGTNVSWGDLLVPKFMNGLGQSLVADWDKAIECEKRQQDWVSANPEKTVEELPACLHPFDQLMVDLREGEVITITDSFNFTPWFSGVSPIDVLMGVSPMSFAANLRVGVDFNASLLWQTSIIRTKKGIQVYLRDFTMGGAGIQFDANYFLNVLRLRLQHKRAKINTKAWVFDYDPELSNLIGSSEEGSLSGLSVEERAQNKLAIKNYVDQRKQMTSAFRAIILDNEPELLDMWFNDHRFDLKHKIENTEFSSKFLFFRDSAYEEGHNLQLLYPSQPDYPDLKREDDMVEIYAHRKAELHGWDWYGLFSDVLDGVFEKTGTLSKSADANPANSIFGKGNWKIVTTEVDLTQRGKTYPPVSYIQHVWGGWELGREDFLDIIAQVNDKFSEVDLGTDRILREEDFRHVEAIDFYRLTATVSFNDKAVEKIVNLLLQPDERERDLNNNAIGEVPLLLAPIAGFFNFIGNHLLGGISDLISDGKIHDRSYKQSDKTFFKELLKILGKGDESLGHIVYNRMCEASKEENHQNENNGHRGGVSYIMMTKYDCVEDWLQNLLFMRRSYPVDDKREQARWTTKVVSYLESSIPTPFLLKYVGKENFTFSFRINGFRRGDEDGDLEVFSNTAGDPTVEFENPVGIMGIYSKETGLVPSEVKRTLGSFN